MRLTTLAVLLYADGMDARTAALATGLTLDTVRSAVRDTRANYLAADRDAGTAIALRCRLVEDGKLAPIQQTRHNPDHRPTPALAASTERNPNA